MERSKVGQLCGLRLRRAYHRHLALTHAPPPPTTSTGPPAAWGSLVGPTASLAPPTIATAARPLNISSTLRTSTIQPATLTRLYLISSPTIALRSALESSVSIPGSLSFSPQFSKRRIAAFRFSRQVRRRTRLTPLWPPHLASLQ